MAEIPGGANTQIAQQAGNPEYVGLSPQQTGQAEDAYMRSIARGPNMMRHQQDLAEQEAIPTGLDEFSQTGDIGFIPEEGGPPPEITSESNPITPNPEEPLIQAMVKLPDGTDAMIEVPQSYDAEDVRNFLIDKGVQGYTPDGGTMERFVYGFRKEGNITSNLQDWGISVFPALAMETLYNPTTGRFETITAEDRYGEDFGELTPQQRRERINEVRAAELKEDYPEINPNNLGAAGTAGTFAKAVADPAALVPVGRAAQGVQSTARLAGRMSLSGAGWGAAYGASEQLSEEGVPLTKGEALKTAERMAGPTVAGAVAGPVIGVPLVRGIERIAGKHISRQIAQSPEKAAKIGKNHIFPQIWQKQAEGLDSKQAVQEVLKQNKMSMHDLWRVREALIRDQYGSRAEFKRKTQMPLPDSGASRRREAFRWDVANSPEEAMKRIGANKGANYGDPILHGAFVSGVDDYMRPIVGTIKDISERVGKRLLDMEGAILRKSHTYHTQFKGFYKGYKRLSSALNDSELERFTLALYNNNRTEARRIWRQANVEMKYFDDAVAGIDNMSREMKAAGVKFDDISGYFPRLVKDHIGLQEYVGKTPKLKGLSAALSEARDRVGGRDLTEAEVAKVANDWLQGVNKKSTKTVKQLKKRTVKEVDSGLAKFYYDPAQSLEFHMREAVSKMERNRFYGKTGAKMDDNGVEDLTQSIGDMIAAEGIRGEAADRLKSVLLSRFGKGEQTGKSWLNATRSIVGGATLGNPVSAIRQLGDLPSVMSSQGPINTIVSLFKRNHPDLNPDVAGYMTEMAQELDTKGIGPMFRKASHALYMAGGFRSMDRYTKGTFMRAAIRKAQTSQKTKAGRRKFMQKYADVYEPDELATLMDDLANGNMSDLVKSHINAEIMKIQPISRSHMPQVYLDHPDGRIWYQFRSWGLNQIEFVRREFMRDIFSKNSEKRMQAAGGLFVLLAGIGVTNAGISQVQRFMTKRELNDAEELPMDVLWQALGNFGLFDRYGMEKWAETQDPKQFMSTLWPPSIAISAAFISKLTGAMFNDEPLEEGMVEVLKQTGFGRLLNFWFFGGAEEYNEKRFNEKLTEMNRLEGIDKMR